MSDRHQPGTLIGIVRNPQQLDNRKRPPPGTSFLTLLGSGTTDGQYRWKNYMIS